MTPLEKIIIEKIKKEGPITFETFMDMALYYPEFGYYTSPETVIGRKGDFFTGPHLHPVFGAMIGKQLEEMWEIIGKPSDFYAVEIGAGAGYLCKDILDYLNRASLSNDKNDFLKSLRYVIVEPYVHFEEKQRELLCDYLKNISSPPPSPLSKGSNEGGIKWILSLKELQDIRGCILSNELLDAFPVHLIEMEDNPPSPLPRGEGVRGRVKEIYVGFDGNNIIEQKLEINSPNVLNYLIEFKVDFQHGYRTEINLKIKDWLKEISEILFEGFVLTVDYGYASKEYYDEERSKGTLLCYHKHQFNENPYEYIGEQDITAHVNFSSVKKWGEELGFKTIGYCSQGTYLISLGIDELISELYSDSTDYQSEILKIKGLILPQGMGESHKIMIQYKGSNLPKLKGFSLRNQAGIL